MLSATRVHVRETVRLRHTAEVRPALRRTAVLFAVLLRGAFGAWAQDKVTQPFAPMARDADPEFEVAVIKPADPNSHSQGSRLNGRRISIESNTMTSLICFAYSIQKSQIVSAPQWFDDQTWNIDGVPDTVGAPNWHQYRRMLQKLLSTRFGLVLHRDKRELPVYAITVAKGGPKLEKSASAGYSERPVGTRGRPGTIHEVHQ